MARMTLDDLVTQLRAAYGGALRAVVLYGSSVAGGGTGASHDVLVVTDTIDMASLRAAAATTRAWGEAGHPTPLTLTTAEWRGSADIFPMEYADVLERHRVLHGELPLDGIRVEPRDLRAQVEHQALGKLLQLRGAIMATGGDPKRQLQLLEQSLSTLLAVFRGVERLHGARASVEAEPLAVAVGARAGFDAAPFVRVARHVRGGERLAPDAAGGILAAYLEAMARLVAHVNAFPTGGAAAPA